MEYRIAHTTAYRYPSPVSVCHNSLILAPRQCSRLSTIDQRLTIRPTPNGVDHRQDMFGNNIHRFSLEENHSQLTITATSRIRLAPAPEFAEAASPTCGQASLQVIERTDPDWLQAAPFLFNSPRIQRSATFADFAGEALDDATPLLTGLAQLTEKIYSEFQYDRDATEVDTPTKTSFEARRGVCQDFAHVALACLRSRGLAAQYVSGYLRTVPPPGQERLVGADQSHAWVSVYGGRQLGWIEIDPTNNCFCNLDHIPIAVGRDYGDVVPIKGVFLGGGEPQLTVSVDVAAVDDSA